jgi:hypothetical protein
MKKLYHREKKKKERFVLESYYREILSKYIKTSNFAKFLIWESFILKIDHYEKYKMRNTLVRCPKDPQRSKRDEKVLYKMRVRVDEIFLAQKN